MTHRQLWMTVVCLCGMALSGCGFHPREELAIPAGLGPVRVVSGDAYSPLGESLARALTRAGAPAAQPTDTHVATLRVVSETWQQGPLSIDAFSHAREDIVTYTVKFSLTSADNRDVSPLQEIRLQRDFVYDDAHALGTTEEQGTIHEDLQRDMAASIIRRIGIALRNFK